MISGGELYNVLSAVVPLYFAMFLGYASVRWWRIFGTEQCSGINRFVSMFMVPILSFDFISRFNPYHTNLPYLAADVLSKAIVLAVLIPWAKFAKGGSLDWLISIFSMSTLANTLVMGIPLVKAMYGAEQENVMIQTVVLQCVFWYTLVIFLMEIRAARMKMKEREINNIASYAVDLQETRRGSDLGCSKVAPDLEEDGGEEDVHISMSSFSSDGIHEAPPSMGGEEGGGGRDEKVDGTKNPIKLSAIMRTVGVKLLRNPNTYASVLGLTWALVSFRWGFSKPLMMEKCVTILSNAGLGTSMFSLGLFMSMQPRIISCGKRLAVIGMVLRFVVGPIVMAAAASTVGIRGKILKVSVIQSALPQAIVSFVFAREYDNHAEIMSTAWVYGIREWILRSTAEICCKSSKSKLLDQDRVVHTKSGFF